jgi:hypothetical protein
MYEKLLKKNLILNDRLKNKKIMREVLKKGSGQISNDPKSNNSL